MPGGRSRDHDAVRRAEASRRAIEAGGLPLAAQERLANLRAGGGGFFTSDLTAEEFLLIRQVGFKPVSQVMGSCFFNMGWQYMPGSQLPGAVRGGGQATPNTVAGGFEYDSFGRRIYWNAAFGQLFELETHTAAWNEARRLALSRLTEETKLAGADAVVGVRLQRGGYGWSRSSVIEFVAIGTAVSSERYDLGEEPVLTNLSGQEFAKLFTSGYWPVGIVSSTAVVHVMTGWQQKLGRSRFAPNQELRDYTQGVDHARKLALSRLVLDGRELGAAGVVGVSVELTQHKHRHERSLSRKQRDMVVTAHILGTAIVQIDGRGVPPPVQFALPLGERH